MYSLMFNVQLMRDYLRKVRCNILFGLSENEFSKDIVYIKDFHAKIWKISK